MSIMKHIVILGSTGSIGESTLQVVRHMHDEIQIAALSAYSNIDTLEKQAREIQPKVVAVVLEEQARELARRLPSNIRVVSGIDGLLELAALPESNMVISAIVGMAGLLPTLHAIKAGKDIGLANKEVLVAAGALVMQAVKKYGVSLLPIDSEHSAIFQCLQGQQIDSIHRLVLTASGGPFRTCSQEYLKNITVRDALRHPTWSMGQKITVDSSTLMNKGLEFIEAVWLFAMEPDRIDIVIHPESIIHSMVEFVDGSMLAQMSEPTMTLPIQYALTYPARKPGMLQPFDFTKNGTLHFYSPDRTMFPCLRLAETAIRQAGTLPCFMNAVNEVLVYRFLKGEVHWQEIGVHLETLMERHKVSSSPSLEELLDVDKMARKLALEVQ